MISQPCRFTSHWPRSFIFCFQLPIPGPWWAQFLKLQKWSDRPCNPTYPRYQRRIHCILLRLSTWAKISSRIGLWRTNRNPRKPYRKSRKNWCGNLLPSCHKRHNALWLRSQQQRHVQHVRRLWPVRMSWVSRCSVHICASRWAKRGSRRRRNKYKSPGKSTSQEIKKYLQKEKVQSTLRWHWRFSQEEAVD